MASTSAPLPATFGKYAVTGLLGEGAMGVVYKAFDPGIGRDVAIKTIRRGLDGDTALADRFANEARAVGRMNHPGIVSIYELGQTDDTAFIVMEYVEGRDLSRLLAASAALPEAYLLKLMFQLLDALEYAHARGVWHRDIKPANLIVTAEGQLKVTDFGIARIESAAITQVVSTIGTPGYMAPEQYIGEQFDHRVDVFAAGVLLYRLLTGKAPFAGTGESVMYHIMHTQPQPLRELLAPELAAFYEPVLDRALAKKPENRFASAAAFSAALQQRTPGRGASSADDETVVVPASPVLTPTALAHLDTGLHRSSDSASHAAPTGWDAEVLAPVQAALARCMGPLAKVVLRNTAKKCSDLDTLVELLAQQLGSEKERTQFLNLLSRQDHSSSIGRATQDGSSSFGSNSTLGTGYGSMHVGFDVLVDVANQVMLRHMGPISKILVKRTKAKARTAEHFMELLLQELPDAAQKASVEKELQAALAALDLAPGKSG